jgi:rubrerythrin
VSNTKENLQTAFAGESQANRKYLFFAEKAEQEGHKQTAKLFRAAADAETVHARNHLKVMEGIRSTGENLLAAKGGENYEFTEMYPAFMKQAQAEGEGKARDSFDLANKVEQIHHGLFDAALSKIEKGEAIDERPIYVCQVCGNTVEGMAPERCPICGAPRRMFKLIE